MAATHNLTPGQKVVKQRTEAIPSWFLTKDGYWLYARLIQPEDQARLVHFFEHLSSPARRRRFHANVDHLPPEMVTHYAGLFATVDNRQTGGAVVATDYRGTGQKIVGVVRLGAPEAGVAEVAVVVRDDFQVRGVGRALLQRMPTLAQRMGVHTVIGTIQADNLPAIRLFQRLNLPMTSTTSHAETVVRITMPTEFSYCFLLNFS